MRSTTVASVQFRLRHTFTISRGSRDVAEVLQVTVTENGFSGHAECVPYARYGESLDSVRAQLDAVAEKVASGSTRDALQADMPSGAARNAMDCALWDLDAKQQGRRVHALAGLPKLTNLTTAYTIGIADRATMKTLAASHADRPILKIKLGTPSDLELLRAVRQGAPKARLIIDANEAWTRDDYLALLPSLEGLAVELIEQPFHADKDAALSDLPRPIAVCADESCHDRQSLRQLGGRYDMINIKLDKTGGLTEALALKHEAQAQGLDIMVGCMVGSSLAMAPAQLVAQGAKFVDLDGPLLLAEDCQHAIAFDGSVMQPATPELWG